MGQTFRWCLQTYEQRMINGKLNISYFVSEVCLKTYIHVRCFVFDPGGYKASVSFNSFFFGSGRNKSDKFIYCPTHLSDIFMLQDHKFEASKLAKIDSGEAIFCEDVFDFYKKIGYDYKTKKYDIQRSNT